MHDAILDRECGGRGRSLRRALLGARGYVGIVNPKCVLVEKRTMKR